MEPIDLKFQYSCCSLIHISSKCIASVAINRIKNPGGLLLVQDRIKNLLLPQDSPKKNNFNGFNTLS